VRFQLRSKSSEGKTNLAAIRTAEESYFAEFGEYIVAAVSPAALNNPSSTKQNFLYTGAPVAYFDTIGWAPEGQVYFRYGVNVGVAGDYTANAEADIDADGVVQIWTYARTANAAVPVLNGPLNCLGAWDGAAAVLPNQVGPCDGIFGQSVF